MRFLHQRLSLSVTIPYYFLDSSPIVSRFIDGNDSYIFVPDGTDVQTLTVHRHSGEIVLNSKYLLLPTRPNMRPCPFRA